MVTTMDDWFLVVTCPGEKKRTLGPFRSLDNARQKKADLIAKHGRTCQVQGPYRGVPRPY
jgi:hypothetical protein